mmetsp:Transcript_22510/g.64775  ORF Transcript_22510/g.64775 Transcript_22510/m.64775 type:complete len:80 (+) Transcript_22510:952-1191(+)
MLEKMQLLLEASAVPLHSLRAVQEKSTPAPSHVLSAKTSTTAQSTVLTHKRRSGMVQLMLRSAKTSALRLQQVQAGQPI